MIKPRMDLRTDRKLLSNFLDGDTNIKLEPINNKILGTKNKKEVLESPKKPKIKKPKGTPAERLRSYLKIV